MSTNRLAAACVAVLSLAAACRTASPPTPAPQPARRGPVPLQLPPVLTNLAAHHVVPAPSSVVPGDGPSFALGPATPIVVSSGSDDRHAEAAHVAEMLGAQMRPATGYRLAVTVSDTAARGAIALRLTDGPAAGDLGDEGYELAISADSVRLTAATPAGLFHAVQTLRQLMPAGIEADQFGQKMATAWTVPPGRIVDRPRFAWRGGMLDVARHFFTVDEVKQYADLLALYKMNVMHLHLADDQGWRIQMDSWPRLAPFGGSTQVGGGPAGWFTKADYAEIVRYARERYITVVPEIDMPGHINAAIASYPEIGCSRPTPAVYAGSPGDSQPPGLYTGIRVGWSTLCPDRDVTYRFVDDVLRELAEMTPGPYLHVGGDEVEALTPSQYAGFVERVQEIVYKYGKTMVGWEEVGKARLRPTTIAQQWRSDSALLALKQGSKLILSPGPKAYLDMKATPATELGLRWAGFVELRDAYDWDPATYFPGVRESDVLGVEAPLWTETVENITAAEYLLLPRLPALAEVGWSAQRSRRWEDFATRIAAHAPRWRLMGANYYPSPQVSW